VTGTLPGAAVRGLYQALGIELPGWSQREASVACFAAPDAHAHGDRDPSCSVNVETGAWHCWGCGAKGGAYDAALAHGLDSRQAFELKVAYGLAQRHPKRPRPNGNPSGDRYPFGTCGRCDGTVALNRGQSDHYGRVGSRRGSAGQLPAEPSRQSRRNRRSPTCLSDSGLPLASCSWRTADRGIRS
jgi:hypothetical protein